MHDMKATLGAVEIGHTYARDCRCSHNFASVILSFKKYDLGIHFPVAVFRGLAELISNERPLKGYEGRHKEK